MSHDFTPQHPPSRALVSLPRHGCDPPALLNWQIGRCATIKCHVLAVKQQYPFPGFSPPLTTEYHVKVWQSRKNTQTGNRITGLLGVLTHCTIRAGVLITTNVPWFYTSTLSFSLPFFFYSSLFSLFFFEIMYAHKYGSKTETMEYIERQSNLSSSMDYHKQINRRNRWITRNEMKASMT